MTTIALHNNRRPIYKTSGNPIGENTENVAFNIPKLAFKVLCDAVRGQNRSAKIRQWIADGMMRENTWSGLAFRAACRLSNEIRSIFAPGSPLEKAADFEKDVATVQPPVDPAEHLLDSLTKCKPDGDFEPTK